MIIVEGTDLVGKTTLCKKICTYLNARADVKLGMNSWAEAYWRYAHMSVPNQSWDFHWGYINHMHPRNVQDRFYLSELAYSAAKDAVYGTCIGERIPPAERMALEGKLLAIGAMTIIITADQHLLESRYTVNAAREMFDFKVVEAANNWYRNFVINKYESTPFIHFHAMQSQEWIPDKQWQPACDEYFNIQVALAKMNRRKPC